MLSEISNLKCTSHQLTKIKQKIRLINLEDNLERFSGHSAEVRTCEGSGKTENLISCDCAVYMDFKSLL